MSGGGGGGGGGGGRSRIASSILPRTVGLWVYANHLKPQKNSVQMARQFLVFVQHAEQAFDHVFLVRACHDDKVDKNHGVDPATAAGGVEVEVEVERDPNTVAIAYGFCIFDVPSTPLTPAP